jgi:hypothetical protein
MAQPKTLLGMVAFCAVISLAACAPPTTLPATQLSFLQPPIAVQSLVGSTPAVLNAEFGQPALRRVDGTSQVWLYHSPLCGLNLILFPDRSGIPRVADAVPDSADPVSCMASLQRTAALEHGSSS